MRKPCISFEEIHDKYMSNPQLLFWLCVCLSMSLRAKFGLHVSSPICRKEEMHRHCEAWLPVLGPWLLRKGLQPSTSSDGLQPASDGLQPNSSNLIAMASNILKPNSDGLHTPPSSMASNRMAMASNLLAMASG